MGGFSGGCYLGYYLRQVRSNAVTRCLLSKWPLAVVGQQLVRLGEGPLARLVPQRRQGVLEDVGGVGSADHGQGAQVAELKVLREELAVGQDDGALRQDVADAPPDLLLGATVGDGVGGHVEEEEVALLGAEDALVDEALGEAFADLLQLVPDLHQVPGLTCDAVVSARYHLPWYHDCHHHQRDED
jgi:hypothetical protein